MTKIKSMVTTWGTGLTLNPYETLHTFLTLQSTQATVIIISASYKDSV